MSCVMFDETGHVDLAGSHGLASIPTALPETASRTHFPYPHSVADFAGIFRESSRAIDVIGADSYPQKWLRLTSR